MFAKVRWSQNMFLRIRNMFCSHLAYPKPNFLYTSKSKLIKNRIWQSSDRNRQKIGQHRTKMLVTTVDFGFMCSRMFGRFQSTSARQWSGTVQPIASPDCQEVITRIFCRFLSKFCQIRFSMSFDLLVQAKLGLGYAGWLQNMLRIHRNMFSEHLTLANIGNSLFDLQISTLGLTIHP